MTMPVFDEYEPAADCGCPGCAQERRAAALGLAVAAGGHPAAHGARRALVLATAAGVVLGGGAPGAASAVAPGHAPARTGADHDPDTPQGGPGPLHGGRPGRDGETTPTAHVTPTATRPALRFTTRAEIIDRAKRWVDARVPYSMEKYWSDGYRQDCSGYVSMAWNLDGNEWTGSLAQYGTLTAKEQLEAGDILLFHNPADPNKGSHVTIFGGWSDDGRTHYIAYEQTRPHTRKLATPYAYWNNSARYVGYRYNGISGGAGGGTGGGGSTTTAYPGAKFFGPGANNRYVTRLGKMLVARGGKRFYSQGPGPGWGEADRRATEAFQRAQGWRGAEADGLPGPHTWRLLVQNAGKDIPAAGDGGQGGGGDGGTGGTAGATAFPGREHFRPGRSNEYVEKLGRQLVKKGYGKHYTSGPGPRWTEADRRNVEAFQRAQGWRGAAADGYPGPQTWRRLFA
ncbi:peptidoglycan-binding protein [Streptomyces albidochromogenes]|uniref:peptidoglycan-binding protein n=1 Tax=Streptomyces albidochromogenes TaxID=329524 RepID=UPI00110F7A37|nr:peptidoglycan-binding protein [Streptomyces albidochromogenes]